jgi:hypothetical protein
MNFRHTLLGFVFYPALIAISASSVGAATLCEPKDNSARILTKPSPNAIHPDWRGDNFIGTGWSFLPSRTLNTSIGVYAQGSLRGSRGGVVNRGVYILLSEWNCSSARQSPTKTRSASSSVEWPVYRNRSPDRVSTERRSQLGNARLTMGCNRVLGPGTGATLYDYDGRGLQRLDDVSRPVAFILTMADGGIRRFSSAMHYFGPDKAWVLSHDLPPAFLRSLAGSVRLTIQNGQGAAVVEFDLQGADKFSGAALEMCSGQGNGASE